MTADQCWVPLSREVTVGRFTIPGGMLYVGEGLASVAGHNAEPALIDPSLPVDRANPDRSGTGMTYWPSYSSISRQCRAGYLEWLLAGRRDPSAYIGYVFLYFYGLERRALADAPRSEAAKQDISAIITEADQLLRVYGNNSSFRRYAAQLLDVLHVIAAVDGRAEPPTDRTGYELPLALRVTVGRMVAAGEPVPAEWALSWFLTHPETRLRSPATRCASEFRRLFCIRYAREFGKGLIVKPNRAKLKITVTPASASFGGPLELNLDIPDIAGMGTPLTKLGQIGESCAADLEPFSRWKGRNPNAAETIATAALLPRELARASESQEAKGLWSCIEAKLGPSDQAICKTNDLLPICASFGGGKLAKSEAVVLAQLLEKGGFAIEPDVRFGGPPLSPDSAAVIFKLPKEAAAIASPQYSAATMLLHLAVAVSAADGSISEAEEKLLEERVRGSLTLSNAERIRLSAHLAWLKETRPTLATLRKRLESLDPQHRLRMAEFIICIAGADGQISPEEIRTLSKIYPMLGLPTNDVYSHLHALSAGGAITEQATEPSESAPVKTTPHSGVRSTPPRPEITEPIRLNMSAVNKKLAESAQISAILDDIFTEEEVTSAPPVLATPGGKISGAPAILLSRLAEKVEWSRADFEALSEECRLLPDGAIDAINEAAFEHTSVAVIEGDDPMQIDIAIAKELLA